VIKMPSEEKIQTYRNPIPTTDIIIQYNDGKKQGIVLITRKNPPYGLALPGGFAEYGISLEDNAKKEAIEETGLDIDILYPNEPTVYSSPDRDPRGHMISHTYIAEGKGKLRAGDDAKTAVLYSIQELEDMLDKDKFAFDHEDIIKDYLYGHIGFRG
jgi:ADP-ribose pyrophosphatase YjhB (NUDIX family)